MRLTIVVMSLLMVGTGPAYAYLDPGTGSLLLQGLVAAIAAGAGAASLFWQRIKEMLGYAPKVSTTDEQNEQAAGNRT